MQNNSHIEPLEERIERFKKGPPVEIVDTLINSIHNFFNNEIRLTTQNDNYQTTLLFLGIHASILTISEAFWDYRPLDGYRMFLVEFLDGEKDDTKFSKIAETIHDWRNNLAHQWLCSSGYSIGYDYGMKEGWKKEDGIIFINPKIYLEHYLKIFDSGGQIYDWQEMFTEEEQEEIKKRLLNKFINN